MRNRSHKWWTAVVALLFLPTLGMTMGVPSGAAEGVGPEVVASAPTNVQTTTATLNGSVDPGGIAVTSCRFEWGTVPSGYPPFAGYAEFNHEASCAPAPGSGTGPVAVSAVIAGLRPDIYYFYRLTAENVNGPNTAVPVELLTLGPPALEGERVVGVGYSNATLQAEIDPFDFDATYRFEYGTTTSYGASQPVPDGTLAAGRKAKLVSESLAGLEPGVVYHYRVVATNATGTTDGPDQIFTTFSGASGPSEACPNASFRSSGLSENLPDCRAYELVSPVEKNDADILGQEDTNLASASGNAVVFGSHNGFGDTRGSGVVGLNLYVATRGTSAWQTHSVIPTPAADAFQVFFGSTIPFMFSSELGFVTIEAQQLPEAEGGIPKSVNLYREDLATDGLQTLSDSQGGPEDPFAFLGNSGPTGGSADDLGVIAFQSPHDFLPQATGSVPKLYAYNHGTLELAGILPDGSVPAGGSESVRPASYESREFANTVSADGSRVFFVSPADGSAQPQLYVREDGTRTVRISQSEASTPNLEPHEIAFQAASADGGEVVFSSAEPLLDADPGGTGSGLYLYTASPHPENESNLTFMGRYAEAPRVLGMSADAQRIYFVSEETLDLWSEGVTRVVTSRYRPAGGENNKLAVSADGERVAFVGETRETEELLAGHGSRGSHVEMYLYDAPSQRLTCVSCPGNGGSVQADVEAEPHATEFGVGIGLAYYHRFISSGGRYVFFNTREALVPQDTNGLTDAYEYDTETGKTSLLTSGTGDNGAWFVNASASGDDAFFVTKQSYGRADTDDLVDLYDVRVDGGLPEPPPPLVPCAGDACQGVPSAAPSFATASGFSGLGNMTSAPIVQKQKSKKQKHEPKKHSAKKRHVGNSHKSKKHARGTHHKRVGTSKRVSGRTGR